MTFRHPSPPLLDCNKHLYGYAFLKCHFLFSKQGCIWKTFKFCRLLDKNLKELTYFHDCGTNHVIDWGTGCNRTDYLRQNIFLSNISLPGRQFQLSVGRSAIEGISPMCFDVPVGYSWKVVLYHCTCLGTGNKIKNIITKQTTDLFLLCMSQL